MKTFKINDNYKLFARTSMEKYRCESFFTKEPETLQWIEELMKNGEVLYDVGANIGVYSLYAASLYPGLRVYGFEPFVDNYTRFCENIRLNGFSNVFAVYMALSQQPSIESFFIKDVTTGSSGHQIGQNIDEWGKEFEAVRTYHVLADTIDNLIAHYGLTAPNHIKIDVDGAEGKIINGMLKLMRNPSLKSVLIEINHTSTDGDEVKRRFEEQGFTSVNEFNKLEDHSRHRRAGTIHESTENVVFVRP